MSNETGVTIAKSDNGLIVVDKDALDHMREVGLAVERTHAMIAAASNDMERMILQAKLMRFLESHITEDVLDCLFALQNNVNGFLTDKKEGYDAETIRQVAVSAWVQGAMMVRNEVNIIAGRCYLTKIYYDRRIKELGLRDYQQQIGQPEIVVTGKTRSGLDKGTALFPAVATWMQHGDRKQVRASVTSDGDFRIPCNYSGSDSPDTLRGKAEAKLWKMVHKMAAGYDVLEKDELEAVVESPAHRIVSKEADDTMTAAQVWDEAEKRTADALAKCHTLKQVTSVEESATKFVDNHDALDDDARIEIGMYLRDLCEQRRELIKAKRGERSNGGNSEG